MKINISCYILLINIIANLVMSITGITTSTALLTQPIIADHTIVNMSYFSHFPHLRVVANNFEDSSQPRNV